MQYGIILSLIIYLLPPIVLLFNYKIQSKYVRYFFFLFVFLLLAMSYNVPTDYQRYCNIVEMTDSIKFSLTGEPIQKAIAYIANMSGQIRMFFVINAFINSIIMFLFYMQHRDKKHIDFMLFIYYFIVILIGFAAIRNGVAIGLSLLAFKYLFEGHKYSLLKYYILIFIAILNHTSAIMMVVLPLIMPIYRYIREKTKYVISVVAPILILMLPLCMSVLRVVTNDYGILSKYYNYIDDFTSRTVNVRWIGLAVIIWILAYGFDRVILKERKDDEFKLAIILSWVALFSMALLPGALIRVCIWFFTFSVFACSRIFDFKDWKVKSFVGVYIVFVLSILVYVGLFGPAKAFPYNTDNSVIWHSDHNTNVKLKFLD